MAKGSKRASIVRRAALTVLESLEGRRLLSASAGSLDSSFGNGGIVTTPLTGPTQDSVQVAIHLNDGKSLVAGSSDAQQILARYNADGSRDTSFGNNGYVLVDGSMLNQINSIGEQNDGKIVAGGEVGGVAAIARFNADGSVDNSFGSDGLATLPVGDGVMGVSVDPSSGTIDASVDDNGDFAVAQLNSDGSMDPTFGNGAGYTTIDLGSDQDIPSAIAVGSNDIYVTGTTIQIQQESVGGQLQYNPYASLAVVDLRKDGSLNTSFGDNGVFAQNIFYQGYKSVDPVSMQIRPADGSLLIGGTDFKTASNETYQFITSVTNAGQINPVFGADGGSTVVNPSGSLTNAGYGIATDSDGNIYLAGSIDNNASITKFNPQGFVDASFGTNDNGAIEQNFGGVSDYRSVWVTADNQVQATGTERANNDANFAQASYNLDGSINAAFGNQGIAIDGFSSTEPGTGRAVVQQSDGKLIAVGTGNGAGSSVIALTRYNTDGSLDTSFGAAGIARSSVDVQDVDGAVLTPDGHILVAFTSNNGSDTDLAVARFNSDGSLDTSFGDNGVAVHVAPSSNDTAVAIGINGDNVYVAGQSSDTSTGATEFEIVSFSATDGGEKNSQIVSFNNNDPDNGPAIDALTGMSVQSDGNIILAGYSYDAEGNFDVALVRLSSDLSLDGSFGNGGLAVNDNGDINQTMAVTTDSSGNVYVADAEVDPNSGDTSEGVMKFDNTGSLVTAFGTGGLATFTIGNGLTNVSGLSVGSDGSITLGGTVQDQDTGLNSDGAARFTSDGQLDPNFGNGGTADVTVDADNGSDAPGFAVQSDGNIVLLGSSDGNFAAVRLVGANGQQTPPPPVANAGPDQTVNEGSTVNFDGSGSTGDDLTYSWDLNGDGTFGDSTSPTPTFTYNDNGSVTVSLQVTDAEGRMSTDTLTVTIDNVAPTASVSGPGSLMPGQPGTFTLGATDPSSVDQGSNFTFNIDWNGDGTVDQTITGPAGTTVTHVFTTEGSDNVTVTATDKDGGQSAPASQLVTVAAPSTVTAQLVADPLNSGQTMLLVDGTDQSDIIELDVAKKTQIVTVLSNGTAIGTYSPTSRIAVFANGGDDSVTHGGGFKRAIEEYGGAGNDTLRAGQSGDILIGGEDDDSLVSGQGNDIEIGGNGADKLVGDAGEDLLIAGYTSYDNNPAALDALSAEWTSNDGASTLPGGDDGFSTRVSKLQNGGGLNGNYVVVSGQTVFDDSVKDTLNGGSGSDWMFYNSTDGKGIQDKDNSVDTVQGDISTQI